MKKPNPNPQGKKRNPDSRNTVRTNSEPLNNFTSDPVPGLTGVLLPVSAGGERGVHKSLQIFYVKGE